MEKNDEIILVNLYDKEIGSADKYTAHKTPMLHRAFSIFIFSGDRILLQKRAEGKYHSAGLWTNSCCSHPRKGEKLDEAIHRRLYEELGMDTELREIGTLVYYNRFSDELFEYEYDHVFIGEYAGEFCVNEEEASEIKWMDMAELHDDLLKHPEKYTVWFRSACPMVLKALEKQSF